MTMVFQGMRIFRMLGLMAGMTTLALAAEFAKPAEGPVAFRRDRIPLEADAMGLLARQIVLLTHSLNAKTAEELRGAAQMLALALALEPGNTDARRLLEDFEKRRPHSKIPVQDLERARSRVWQHIAWLETPEAGENGQALAACLKDVIVLADPGHPKSAALREAGEQGAWAGWVPELAAFRKPEIASQTDRENDKPEDDPAETPEVPAQPAFQLAKAQVETVAWQKIGAGDATDWALAKVPLGMTAGIQESTGESNPGSAGGNGEDAAERRKFILRIGSDTANGQLIRTSRNLMKHLVIRHEKLPRGGHIHITSPEFESSLASQRSQSVSAAAAVLADSALTGVEPTGIILGAIDESGAYHMSAGFWKQLRALGQGTGQRLIVPTAAADLLPSMLAMEKPEFFLNNEVLVAADFEQLLKLSAKTPAGPLAETFAKFLEIRDKAGSQDIRVYVSNKFVRERLAAVAQDAPYHLSSRLLLMQSAGNRPTLVARSVLAAELQRVLEPVGKIAMVNEFKPDSTKLEDVAKVRDDCRAKIDEMVRYADKADRELIDQAQVLMDLLRNLDRAARTRGEDYIVVAAVMSAHRDLNRAFRKLNEQLAQESGGQIAESPR